MIQPHCSKSIFKEASLTGVGERKGHVPCLTKAHSPPSSTANLKTVTDSLDHYHTEWLPLFLSHARNALNTLEDPANAVQCQLFDKLTGVVSPACSPEPSRWQLHRTSAQLSFLKQSCRKNLLKLSNPCSFLLYTYKDHSFPPFFPTQIFLIPPQVPSPVVNSRVLICQAFHP